MVVAIVLNLNRELSKLEEIANKCTYTYEGHLFSPMERYPLEDRYNIKQTEYVTNIPRMPYKCVPCFVSMMYWYIYRDNILDTRLYKENPYINSTSDYFRDYMLDVDEEEVIREYFEEISDSDMLIAIQELSNLYENHVRPHTAKYKNYVFNIRHDSVDIIIEILGSIKEVRFDEFKDKLPTKEEKNGYGVWEGYR